MVSILEQPQTYTQSHFGLAEIEVNSTRKNLKTHLDLISTQLDLNSPAPHTCGASAAATRRALGALDHDGCRPTGTARVGAREQTAAGRGRSERATGGRVWFFTMRTAKQVFTFSPTSSIAIALHSLGSPAFLLDVLPGIGLLVRAVALAQQAVPPPPPPPKRARPRTSRPRRSAGPPPHAGPASCDRSRVS